MFKGCIAYFAHTRIIGPFLNLNHDIMSFPAVQVDWPASGSLFEGFDSGGECGVAYSRRLPMPAPRLDSSDTLPGRSARLLKSLWGGKVPGGSHRVGRIRAPWYSFDHGMVHVVMMSTEHDFR